VIFEKWITPGSEALFFEEPGCSSSTPYAHEFDSTVTCNGSSVDIAYEGDTFTAIRYANIVNDPACGGSSSGSGSGSGSGSSGGSSSGSGGASSGGSGGGGSSGGLADAGNGPSSSGPASGEGSVPRWSSAPATSCAFAGSQRREAPIVPLMAFGALLLARSRRRRSRESADATLRGDRI
jgi:hypothetical protein